VRFAPPQISPLTEHACRTLENLACLSAVGFPATPVWSLLLGGNRQSVAGFVQATKVCVGTGLIQSSPD
jgi:hypothetical protein